MRGFVVQHTPKPLPVGAPSHGGIAFLDRDGVLNIGSPNYINSPDEFVELPDAAASGNSTNSSGELM